MPCFPPSWEGGFHSVGTQLQGFRVDVFLVLFKMQDKAISSCFLSTGLGGFALR